MIHRRNRRRGVNTETAGESVGCPLVWIETIFSSRLPLVENEN
jgi:hypothetical protein